MDAVYSRAMFIFSQDDILSMMEDWAHSVAVASIHLNMGKYYNFIYVFFILNPLCYLVEPLVYATRRLQGKEPCSIHMFYSHAFIPRGFYLQSNGTWFPSILSTSNRYMPKCGMSARNKQSQGRGCDDNVDKDVHQQNRRYYSGASTWVKRCKEQAHNFRDKCASSCGL